MTSFAEFMRDPADWFEEAARLARLHHDKLAGQEPQAATELQGCNSAVSATNDLPSCSAEDQQRFWSKVEKSDDGCWHWRSYLNKAGYGYCQIRGKTKMAHRLAYELLVGPIPEGLHLDHLCRVRHCVNPAHLEPVTPRENNARSASITAAHARKTHCLHGHPYDEANTRVRPGGGRTCRKCHAIACNRRYHALKAEDGAVNEKADESAAPCAVIRLDSQAETMSADNYLYVGRIGNGRYGLWHCFASDDDPLRGNRPRATFDTADEAIKAAHKLDQREYHEYGVQIEPEAHSEWVAS